LKAMILAAGVGERMRPLTDSVPKPLLTVAGTPLVEHHLIHLAEAGFTEVVINVSHLGQQIIDYCGDGSRWDVAITYSPEQSPLETAGGIHNALELLGDAAFLLVNGDVWVDAPFAQLRAYRLRGNETAHLLMVDNPPQHPQGDFHLDPDGWVQGLDENRSGLTYAGVAIYSRAFFSSMAAGKLPMRPLLDAAIAAQQLGGEYCDGEWVDVGTPERLDALDALVKSRP
jgi:MurNAc alpha-1-phosphate uridylyltransferase